MLQEPISWEVIDPFVLLAYANLATSETLSQWLLACLNFILDSHLLCWCKWNKYNVAIDPKY